MSEPITGELLGDAQVIIDTAVASATPATIVPESLLTVVAPRDSMLHYIDVEAHLAQYRDTPARKKGAVVLTNPDSLSQYVNEHKSEATEVFADWRTRRAVAVLNDHSTGEAGWGDHRAVLTLVATPEWERWANLDRKWLTQEDFAEHILDTTADVVSPDAADLLEMAETFTARQSVDFKSGSRLRDGQRQLTYVENILAGAGESGNVTIPEKILLELAPFDGASLTPVAARIRYRINAGELKIGYVLDRPDLVLRSAFAEVIGAVEVATEISALWGTART